MKKIAIICARSGSSRIKNKNLNNVYKGLTAQMVKETFGWNDDFVRINK